ncbi:MAG: M24 family metallopeptidase [Candidatus Hydrogenedentes bacterium]|nr:M24 family metallopeptidase [Candidatus Hydrogenedentota bacterium]
MDRKELFYIRVALLRIYLEKNNFDGILISRVDNFAMATGGCRNYIWKYSDLGANSLLVTKDGEVYYVGNNIEEKRILEEELNNLTDKSISFLWFEDSPHEVVLKHFGRDKRFVSDDGSIGRNVNNDLSVIKALLTPVELEKYKKIGKLASEAMTATLKEVKHGATEVEISARLVYEGHKRGCLVPVALIASDDRIEKYRHPLPTERLLLDDDDSRMKKVENYVMVVGCFLKEGLVVSLTRFKRVGKISEEIEDAYRRICGVDALIQENTLPGRTLGDVFEVIQNSYTKMGFPPNEWHNHHQGGATGYAGRTCKGRPGETFPVLDTFYSKEVSKILGKKVEFGSAFAWNPSAKGVKSEDTFILYPDGYQEIVTMTPDLPNVNLEDVLGRHTKVIKSGMAMD